MFLFNCRESVRTWMRLRKEMPKCSWRRPRYFCTYPHYHLFGQIRENCPKEVLRLERSIFYWVSVIIYQNKPHFHSIFNFTVALLISLPLSDFEVWLSDEIIQRCWGITHAFKIKKRHKTLTDMFENISA